MNTISTTPPVLLGLNLFPPFFNSALNICFDYLKLQQYTFLNTCIFNILLHNRSLCVEVQSVKTQIFVSFLTKALIKPIRESELYLLTAKAVQNKDEQVSSGGLVSLFL